MKKKMLKLSSGALLATIILWNGMPTMADTNTKCAVNQSFDQTIEQNQERMTIRITAQHYGKDIGIDDRHLPTGWTMVFDAKVYQGDQPVNTTHDMVWTLTTQDGKEPQAAVFQSEEGLFYVKSRCAYPEKLTVRAKLAKDESVQSDPYDFEVVSEYENIVGLKQYFNLNTGIDEAIEIPQVKEAWNREKNAYTIQLPSLSSKNELMAFRGWKGDRISKYKEKGIETITAGGWQMSCDLVAQWKKRNPNFTNQNQKYKVIDGSRYKARFVKYSTTGNNSFLVPAYVDYRKQANGVAEIGKGAFQNANLKTVSLPHTVKKIGGEAFFNCKNLKKININSTQVTSIGKNALKGIHKNAVIYCPKQCVKKYKTLLKRAGLPSSAKVKAFLKN